MGLDEAAQNVSGCQQCPMNYMSLYKVAQNMFHYK